MITSYDQDEIRIKRLAEKKALFWVYYIVVGCLIVQIFDFVPKRFELLVGAALVLSGFVLSLGFKSILPKLGTAILLCQAALSLFYEFGGAPRPPSDEYTLMVGLTGFIPLVIWGWMLHRKSKSRIEALIVTAQTTLSNGKD